MSERPKQSRKASAERRLAAALRANLKRRKAQARGRQEVCQETSQEERHGQGPAGPTSGVPHDSAGIGAEK